MKKSEPSTFGLPAIAGASRKPEARAGTAAAKASSAMVAASVAAWRRRVTERQEHGRVIVGLPPGMVFELRSFQAWAASPGPAMTPSVQNRTRLPAARSIIRHIRHKIIYALK